MQNEPTPATIRLDLSRREAGQLAELLDWAVDESDEIAEQANEDGETDTVDTFREFARIARATLALLEAAQ